MTAQILGFGAFFALCAWRCGVASRKVLRALAEELDGDQR